MRFGKQLVTCLACTLSTKLALQTKAQMTYCGLAWSSLHYQDQAHQDLGSLSNVLERLGPEVTRCYLINSLPKLPVQQVNKMLCVEEGKNQM